jgi:hypothetical protein
MKQGNWKYIKTNNTLQFKTQSYSYEIDLDIYKNSKIMDNMIEHLKDKNQELISYRDLDDLQVLFNKIIK